VTRARAARGRAIIVCFAALACAGAGCAAADAPATASVGTVMLAPPPLVQSAAPLPTAELPRELAAESVACSVRGRTWRVSTPVTLHLAAVGPSFAEAWSGRAEVSLPSGPITSTLLRLDTPELTLVGWVQAMRVPIAPARPLLLAGYLSPKPRPVLVAIEALTRRVQVALPLAEVEAGAVRDSVACNDLSLDALPFDPRPAIESSGKRRAAALSAARPVPLSIEPGETPVARLRASSSSRDVTVVAVRGAGSRILWELDDAFVLGWVASTDLAPPRSVQPAPPSSDGRAAPSTGAPIARVECARDVPLVAGEGPERAAVGAARAGARVELLDRGVGFRRVRVPTTGARTGGDAPLLAREVDLETCKHVLAEP
jgi:hypothetical protein